MQLERLITLIICSIFLLSFFIISSVAAEDTIENLVEATFNIKYISGSELNIEIILNHS